MTLRLQRRRLLLAGLAGSALLAGCASRASTPAPTIDDARRSPAPGQRIDVGRARLTAIGAEIHQRRVVDEDEDDVGTFRRRVGLREGGGDERDDECEDGEQL